MIGRLIALACGAVFATQAQTRYALFTFDAPNASFTAARGINNNGDIVGAYHDSSGDHSFLRTGSTYVSIEPPSAKPGMTAAAGINNTGQVVGTFSDAFGQHGFLRASDGSFTVFDTYLPASINDRGEITGSVSSFALPTLGYVRDAAGNIVTFRVPGASQTRPAGINNAGAIVGTYITGGSYSIGHGFLRMPDGTFTTFDFPGLEPTRMGTWAAAINNHGQIAGYLLSYGYGFVRDPDGTFSLVTGPGQVNISGIDDSGRLVGYYSFDGATHGLLATPGTSSSTPAIRSLLGVSSASGFGGDQAIAPGSWMEIYGYNLSKTTRSWQSSDFSGDMAPTALDGVSVTINGRPAFVSYVSPGQVNALVPSTVEPGTAQVVVASAAQRTAPYSVPVKALLPGIAAVASESYSSSPLAISLPAGPVKAGDTIVLFGIGFGPVTPTVPAGNIARGLTTLAGVTVTFDGVPARIVYAGLSPGSVGLYQFNVTVPESAAPGGDFVRYAGLVASINGVAAQTVLVMVD